MLFFQIAGTSRLQSSSASRKYLGVSLERHETPKRVSASPISTETSHNSARMSPVPPILSRTAPSALPSTSSAGDEQIQRALGDSAMTLQSTWKKCTYKKISELLEREKKVNIYGVIHTIVKVKLVQNLAYIVCGY